MRQKDEIKERAIAKAVVNIVANHGLTAVSMSAVAKKAAIGTSTLYTYHSDKLEMLEAIYRQIKQELVKAVMQEYDEKAAIPLTFRRIIKNYLLYLTSNRSKIIFADYYSRSDYCTIETQAETDEYAALILQTIEKGIQQQYLKELPATEMLMAVDGIIKNMTLHQTIPLDKARNEAITQLCWDCIKR